LAVALFSADTFDVTSAVSVADADALALFVAVSLAEADLVEPAVTVADSVAVDFAVSSSSAVTLMHEFSAVWVFFTVCSDVAE